MNFVKFENRKNYRINEIGILCDYEPVQTSKSNYDPDTFRIGDNRYIDPHYYEDLTNYYKVASGLWWESRYYYDNNRVVVLDSVDTNVYMFDKNHGSQVFRKIN